VDTQRVAVCGALGQSAHGVEVSGLHSRDDAQPHLLCSGTRPHLERRTCKLWSV
jgi:hypothetical protein